MVKKIFSTFVFSFLFLFSIEAGGTTSQALDISNCLPFLRQVAFNRQSRIPDDPVAFARSLITQYDIFKNPLLATVAFKRIGEDKLNEWVKAGIKEEDIDAAISADIFDQFLKELHPDETNADELFSIWQKTPKDFGEIKWDDFKTWQDLAREFTYEPRKAELGSGFLRAFLPEYAKYLSVWNSYRKPLFRSWNLKSTIQSIAGGLGGFALVAAVFDGGASALVVGGIGIASPAFNRYLSKWKNSRLNNRLANKGPQNFKEQIESKNLLPSDIEYFKLVLGRVVDLEKLNELEPKIDLTSKTSIMEFGAIFNPLMLAAVNLLTDLQHNIYLNLKTDDLRARFPEDELKVLDARLADTNIEGLITDIERLRKGIADARRKVELLKEVFLVIREKMSKFIDYLERVHEKTKSQPDIDSDIVDRQQHFHELFGTAEQISQTMDVVDSSIAIDNRYLDALSRAIASRRVQKTLEMNAPAKLGTRDDRPSGPPTTPKSPSKGSSLF